MWPSDRLLGRKIPAKVAQILKLCNSLKGFLSLNIQALIFCTIENFMGTWIELESKLEFGCQDKLDDIKL